MRRAQATRVMEGLVRAFGTIGSDSTWCTAPVTVDRAVLLPIPEAVARPAYVIKEPNWSGFTNEVDVTLELGVADLIVEVYLYAGTDGYSGDIADELHGMAEDAVRATIENFRLLDDDDEPVLAFHLIPGSFEFDEDLSVVAGIAIGKLTLAGRIDFPTPRQGGN